MSTHAPRAWKGKAREQVSRQEGPGGAAGVVLPLQLLTSSPYESIYTLPILVGSDRQNLSLQVDTGSSDLWIASTSCSTSACGQTGGHLYDPSSSSTPTNQSFSIAYAEGSVSGPIVWDAVSLGGYNVTSQALAAASSVANEPLEGDFSGILGLALPLDSKIAQIIPSEYTNSPDGAAFASNLFGTTPSNASPAAPFLSLALERPGSNSVPSVLGIGRHPDGLVPDPSKIQYASLVTDQSGVLFWEASVRAITVYVDGKAKEIELGTSVSGAAYPSAVLDSGTPVILASAAIANGIYGALGISPSSDGSYYVPCTMPINMTITLDDRRAIPLHPLDLTYAPNSGSNMCTGMIQNSEEIGSSYVNLPDLILGVPFLRNTYTVMAYEPPAPDGQFPPNDTVATAQYELHPQLGLLGLTNITTAMDEFTTVRVMNEPLDPSSQQSNSSSLSPKHLSIGVDVVLGLIGLFVFCLMVFGARWVYMRRRWRSHPPDSYEEVVRKDALPDISYILTRRTSFTDRYSVSDDTLRTSHYSDHQHRKGVPSQYSDARPLTRTHVVARDKLRDDSPGRSTVDSGDRDSFFAREQRSPNKFSKSKSLPASPPDSPGHPPNWHRSSATDHHRMSSDELGVAVPLLVHTRSHSHLIRSEDVADLGVEVAPYPAVEILRPQSLASVRSISGGGGPDRCSAGVSDISLHPLHGSSSPVVIESSGEAQEQPALFIASHDY